MINGLQAYPIPVSSVPAAIEMIRRNAGRAAAFAAAFADLLGMMVPCGVLVRSFERDERVEHLAHTMELWLVGDAPEQIAALESRSYQSFATPETLMELVKMRDRLSDQIAAMESQFHTFDQLAEQMPQMSGLRGMVEAQVMPLRNQLEDLEEQISAVQKQLEATATPEASA
jgi:hypothetical protein